MYLKSLGARYNIIPVAGTGCRYLEFKYRHPGTKIYY